MEKEKPRILLFLLIFYQRDHRNQSLLPRHALLVFAGGAHQPLVFFIFLRSHYLSNREFLCAEARLPSGGHIGELQPGGAVGTIKCIPHLHFSLAFSATAMAWGPGLTLRCPRGGGARANTPPLCQSGYGPQCIPVQSPTLVNKNNFLINICVCALCMVWS